MCTAYSVLHKFSTTYFGINKKNIITNNFLSRDISFLECYMHYNSTFHYSVKIKSIDFQHTKDIFVNQS